MSVFALVGGQVFLPDGVRDGLAVIVENGVITATQLQADVAPSVPIVDVGGRLIAPGFIDLHAHGAVGRSFDEPDPAAHQEILQFHARHGVTAMQASLVSATWDDLDQRLEALAETKTSTAGGPTRLGAHLEGPFLAPSQCGAHDPAVLRTPTPRDVDKVLTRRGIVTMITIAPELPGSLTLVRRLADAGVVVAAGHSEARGDDLWPAVDAGLSHLTHLWSGQSALVRHGPWRIPGLLEESLASDGLTAEVIADGRHLPPHSWRSLAAAWAIDLPWCPTAPLAPACPTDFATGSARWTAK